MKGCEQNFEWILAVRIRSGFERSPGTALPAGWSLQKEYRFKFKFRFKSKLSFQFKFKIDLGLGLKVQIMSPGKALLAGWKSYSLTIMIILGTGLVARRKSKKSYSLINQDFDKDLNLYLDLIFKPWHRSPCRNFTPWSRLWFRILIRWRFYILDMT